MSRLVLVADDDAEVRRVLREYLESRGLQVIEAADGLEALVQAKRLRPQYVVLDVMMPRLGGLGALESQLFAGSRVVVITGASDVSFQREALARGACAFLTKPFDLAQLGAAFQILEGSSRAAGEGGGAPGRVLVVDDEAEILSVLMEFLVGLGYDCAAVNDGVEALQRIRSEPAAVVLLDINMPRLSGIEALKAIRAIDAQAKVIMVSGIADVQQAKLSLAYGAFDYVQKPIDFPYLKLALEAAFVARSL